MPIRDFWGFDHCPIGAGLPQSGYAYDATTTNVTIVQYNTGQYRLTMTAAAAKFVMNLTTLGLDTTTKTIIGFRVNAAPIANFTINMFNASNAVASGTAVTGTTLGLTAGSDNYVEMVFDWVNFTVAYYTDSVLKTTITYTSTTMAAILSTYFRLALTCTTATANGIFISDLYFRDQISGDTAIAPIGPQTCKPITLSGAVATGWTITSGYTANAALTASYVDLSTSLTTPLVTTILGASAQPITATLTDSAGAMNNPKAVKILHSANSTDPGRNIKTQLSYNGNTATGTTVAEGNSYAYGASGGVFLTAPDGSAWSQTKINATTLTLTITSST